MQPNSLTAVLADVATVIGSVFTGVSVLFALWVYRRREDRETFARLRLALVDIKQDLARLDRLLDEAHFTDIANNIVERIDAMLPSAASKDDVLSFLSEEHNHNQIAGAINLGYHRSDLRAKSTDVLDRLSRSVVEHQELLPVLSEAITACVWYPRRTALTIASPRIFNQVLGSKKAIDHWVLDDEDIKRANGRDEVLRELRVILTAVPSHLLKAQGQQIIDEAQSIVTVLVDRYSRMTDAELRRESRRQKGLAGRLYTMKPDPPIDRAFECLQLLRGQFTNDSWDTIVASKTKVEQLLRTSKQE